MKTWMKSNYTIEEILLEEYEDIGCKLYMCVEQKAPSVYSRYYLVGWKRPECSGCKKFGDMEQVTVFINKLRNQNNSTVNSAQKDLGNKILDILIAEGDRLGEMQQRMNELKMSDHAKIYELRSNEALRLADLVNDFLNKEVN